MRDWNVVISVYQEGFRRVLRALRDLGPTERSPYYNVLVMQAGPIGPARTSPGPRSWILSKPSACAVLARRVDVRRRITGDSRRDESRISPS